ncbi:MAG: LLM class flavin-dependent oxidoreductase [SAR202 cluster bacterium]|nr:LLM class flavin-dependent oxidoreductase [Dehalococcoidia bacterium]MCS5656293.1 LLM class flavin-dependent oxidoreductase [Dehalococcoidia bacterium]MQG48720.1 LLM class flavin-dependent oxidoreductase [SAR202 cluster bacterium]MQG78531.1 LLM class flavin-dependent oxidoreductase [SAR202 cluster bacterium]|tara:strand:- start:133 stop:1131 length:999 start_codon:yes stop_codon:yes gene_type:complete
MQFGMFGSAQAKRGGPNDDSGAGFREFVERNVEAESLGYHSTFLVEHHFTGFGQVSATLNLLTWIGARTTSLRLGTAVIVLPWHNPVLLAEQIATLDLLSNGRVDAGIGKGYRMKEFEGFSISMDEADARFEECLEVMLKAWTSDTPWSHQGTYWQYNEVVVEPPSTQKPHPQIWMGAGSPRSVKQVAQLGFNMLLGQFDSFEMIAEEVALFKSEVESLGRVFNPMSVAVARSVNLVDSTAEYDQALESRMAARRRTQNLALRPDFQDTRDSAEAGTIYGSPDQVSEKIQALHDIGIEYVLLNAPAGISTLRRFAKDVMPGFLGDNQAAAKR